MTHHDWKSRLHIVRMCCRMPTPCQVIKSDTIRKRQSTGAILARIVQQCLGQVGVVGGGVWMQHDMMSPGWFGWFMSIAKQEVLGLFHLQSSSRKLEGRSKWGDVAYFHWGERNAPKNRQLKSRKHGPKQCNRISNSMSQVWEALQRTIPSKRDESFATWNLFVKSFMQKGGASSQCKPVHRNVTKAFATGGMINEAA